MGAGPETWWIYYPSASGGMQSPIDVCTEEVLYDPELRHNPLELSYWRASTAVAAEDDDEEGGGGGGGSSREKLVLVNTGNTARLDVVNNSSCECHSSGFCKDYERLSMAWNRRKRFVAFVFSAASSHFV